MGKLLAEHFFGLQKTLKEEHLISGRPLDWATPIFQLADADVDAVCVATSATISVGIVKVGDVLWADWGADKVTGVAQGYISIGNKHAVSIVYAHVILLEAVGEKTWRLTPNHVLLATSLVRAVLTYVDVAEGIRPIIPRFRV